MVIVFCGPGWLCQDYWTKCTIRDSAGLCTEYNPFYTDQVYHNDKTVKWWTDKNLKVEDFNPDGIKALNCLHGQKKSVAGCNEYWTEI